VITSLFGAESVAGRARDLRFRVDSALAARGVAA
jgi:thiamine-phosphate pyrophosphorylase